MNDNKLVLYVDNDFIIPIIGNYSGNVEKFTGTDEGRLWLFFKVSRDSSSTYEFGKNFKAGYSSNLPGYLGDFWNKLDKGEKYTKNGTGSDLSVDYTALLGFSGIIHSLTQFFSINNNGQSTDIPTVYVFANNIPKNAKKLFMEFMESKGFLTENYSHVIEDLCAKYYRRTDSSTEFGQKVLSFHNSGDDILMSCMVFDGNEFQYSENKVLEKAGEDPIRTKLAQYVVDKLNYNNVLRDNNERNNEVNYQKQFVDEWLQQRTLQGTDVFYIKSHLSIEPDKNIQISIDNRQLDAYKDEQISNIIINLKEFRNRVVNNDLIHVLLIGDAFVDDDFREKINGNMGRNSTYFSYDHDIKDILALYFTLPEVKESLSSFDKIDKQAKQRQESVKLWIGESEKIRSLEGDAKNLHERFLNVNTVFADAFRKASRNAEIKLRGDRENNIKGSNFNDARKCLSAIHSEQENVKALLSNVENMLNRIGGMEQTFNRVEAFEGAKRIKDSVEMVRGELQKLQGSYTIVCDEIDKANAVIDHLEECYPLYKQKLKEFERENNISVRKRILKEIEDGALTLEELPIVELTEELEVKITAELEVKKSGGFLGFGASTKKSLKVCVEILKGASLPCRGVVIIQGKPLVKIDRTICRSYDIERGESGIIFNETIELPLVECKDAGTLYVYFKPHEDESLNINAFTANRVSIQV